MGELRATKHFLFLHIPKAGGTTLRAILDRQFFTKNSYVIGSDIYGDINRFKAMPIQKAEQFELVIGHMRFGLHSQFKHKFCYLSMLREPVSRVISEYRFLHSNPYHPLNASVGSMSVDEYLHSNLTDQISNGQVRLLSGAESYDANGAPIIRPMTQDDLDIALNNIDQYFPQIGFVERYDESLLCWQRLFNWRRPFYTRENSTLKQALPVASITQAQKDKIIELNQLDIILYQTLLARFDAYLAKQGVLFQIRLKSFRALNRLFGLYKRIV